MNNNKYNGVVVPMVTPVTPNGFLDKQAVERIIKSFVKAGVSYEEKPAEPESGESLFLD